MGRSDDPLRLIVVCFALLYAAPSEPRPQSERIDQREPKGSVDRLPGDRERSVKAEGMKKEISRDRSVKIEQERRICSTDRMRIICYATALSSLAFFPAFGDELLPAFPGAEGFGAETPGGRGGGISEVTHLKDSGPGSFRAACEAEVPRIGVFRTGGTIEVLSRIVIGSPFVTIAGQTAPGDGILLKADPGFDGPIIQVASHDVVIRGLRIRRGPNGRKGSSGDGLSIHNQEIPGGTAATQPKTD